MKTQKIILTILIVTAVISSIELTIAQNSVNKSYIKNRVKYVTELVKEKSNSRKLHVKHSEKGNLNEFKGDTKIVLENWMLNPETWSDCFVSESRDESINLTEWMLRPEIMGNKIAESYVSKDKEINLEDWMLSPEKMMNQDKKENTANTTDSEIELSDWMLNLADFREIQ